MLQSSVLFGPLFLIYIDSLCLTVALGGMFVAFEDDTTLFYKGDSLAQIQNNMQYDVIALR